MKSYFKHNSLSIKDSNFLKGIGILLIAFHNFFHHISPMPGENEFDFNIGRINNVWLEFNNNPLNIIDLTFSFLGHYGVQIFILISGYGLFRAYGAKKIPWRNFISKRLNKLYPTYIFAIIILIIFNKYWYHTTYPFIEYLQKLTFATNFIPGKIFSLNGPWWFYGMIVELYMVFPLLVFINKKLPKTGLVAIALFSYIIMLLSGDFFIQNQQSLHYHFLGNLPVFIFGMLMARKDEFRIHWSLIALSLLLFIAGNINSSLYYISHLSIAIILFISVLKIQVSLGTNSRIGKIIYFYGEISMYLFAIHGFLRGPFIDMVNGIQNPYLRPFTTIGAAFLFVGFSTIVALFLRWIVNNYSRLLKKLADVFSKKKYNKVFLFLNNYIVIYLAFISLIIIFRIGEFFYITRAHPFINWSSYEFINSLFRDILMSTSYMGILFIPMGLLTIWKTNISKWFSIIISSTFFILYLSLIEYFNASLTPLDKVILAYSPAGIWNLIESSSPSLFYFALLILFILSIFILFIRIFSNLFFSRNKAFLMALFVVALSTQMKYFYADESKFSSEQTYYANTFKPAYLFHSLYQAFKESTDYQRINIHNIAKKYQESHPEKDFIGTLFPLLHKQEKSSLSPFFKSKKKPTKPNVVIIICESLSNTVSGKYSNYTSLTPFLDSLANHSLYWPNTLSSAERTFGALPSVLGSLPQVNKGFLDLENKMPDYIDLITTLNKLNYKTRFFYGGWANFNFMDNYLNKSNIDEIITDYPNYKKIPKNEKGFSWGYDDEAIFQGSFSHIDSLNPYLSIYLTLSSHSPFMLNNHLRYENIVRQLINESSRKSIKEEMDTLIPKLATFAFLDEQLNYFFKAYKKRKDYQNTIFVITGDHRTILLKQKNRLDKYHVPLIIFSPMLIKEKEFKALASHEDIWPSLGSLLNDNFHQKTPYYIPSIGYQLDTGSTFRSKGFRTLIRNSRETKDVVYNNYFISGDLLFQIHDSLNLKADNNDSIKTIMKSYLSNINDLSNFIINNNKILPQEIYNKEIGSIKIAEIKTDFEEDVDVYYNGQLTDSFAYEGRHSLTNGPNEYTSLFPETSLNATYKSLIMEIDFMIYVSDEETKNPLMVFSGTNTNGENFYWEGYNFIKELNIEKGKWKHIWMKKTIFIKGKYKSSSKMKFYFWNQKTSSYYIDNMKITLKATIE